MPDDFLHIGTYEDLHRLIAIHREPFGLSVADRRQHVHIAGQSGMGKSTLLERFMVQDLQAGRGFGVLDPHGDLALASLDQVPRWRSREVIYFDPANLERPLSLNILAGVSPEHRPLVADDVVAIFESIWGVSSWGPRLPWVLYCAVRTLLDHGGSSLLGVTRLLTDDRYRARMLRHVTDPYVRQFWTDEFAGYDDRKRSEVIGPILNKIGPFLATPALRNVLGQEGRALDFTRLMDDRRLFIANLAKGRLGEQKSNLIGSLLVTKFKLAAMRRAAVPEHTRVDFALYVDEFQNFTTSSFEETLAEARKYRLGLVMAHQYLEQLSDEVRAAVFGTVRTQIAFCVGQADAEPLARAFGGSITAAELVSLNRSQVVARLMNGSQTLVVRGDTEPPTGWRFGSSEKIIKSARFGQPRAKVERQIARMLAPSKREEPYPWKRKP